MIEKASERNLRLFLERLPTAASRVLMIDFDGTLAPFQADRDTARPYPGVVDRLDALAEQEATRIVVVTGREAGTIRRLLPLARPFEVWGEHGRERLMPDGRSSRVPIDPGVSRVLAQALGWVQSRGWVSSLEVKPAALALHWRDVSEGDAASMESAARHHWGRLATGPVVLHAFDGGLELRLSDVDKGRAVNAILDEEDSRAAVAYLGDDLTDEDAFNAIHGRGLAVLVRDQVRPTAADAWLRPPEELLDFLDSWRRQCSRT
jgi:trehalose-phosphatase